MMRILEMQQERSGQWKYRVIHSDGSVAVAWQWGPHDEMEAFGQASDRYTFTGLVVTVGELTADEVAGAAALEEFAAANYEQGGHWVVETHELVDYVQALRAAGGDVEVAKADLRSGWELQTERAEDAQAEIL